MRKLIINNDETCVGCNRCVRACPIDGASVTYKRGDQIKVRINEERCIACGACISSCRHDVRDYDDDTERFLTDLQNGVPISMFAAPAYRAGGIDGDRVLAWLRNLGVRKMAYAKYTMFLSARISVPGRISGIYKRTNPRLS